MSVCVKYKPLKLQGWAYQIIFIQYVRTCRPSKLWISTTHQCFLESLQVLLATLSDNVVVSKQTGKVRDKDRTWDSVKKSLLGNINGFLEELKV